jgi:protease-4
MRFLSTLLASALGTLIAFGVLVLFVFFFFFALALSGDQKPPVTPNSILVAEIDGSIPERVSDDPFQQAFGGGADYDLRDLQSALRNAAADDRIRGVWLRMKGTNASWATLEEVRSSLLAFRESGKPVIASSGEFGMGEKEYFLATAADSVFSAPVSPFELNGFVSTATFFKNALDRLNIESKTVRAGKYKSAVEPFLREDLSEPNRQQLTALLETTNSRFKEGVSATRGITPDELEQMADENAVLDAAVAAERGLIDGLRYEDEVVDVFRGVLDLAASADVPTIGLDNYSRQSASDAGITTTGNGSVAIVYAEGQIIPGESPDFSSNGQIGSTTLIEAVRDAQEASDVKAIVLRVNSPGGSAAASEVMWRALQDASEDKPLIVSMGNLAASGGYYIAAPADTIVANPTTITGSIGVFGQFFNTREFFEEELGVTFDAIQTSPYADIYSFVEPFSDAERRLLAASIDRTYDTFLERVAAGRGMDTSAVNDVAQGRVWSGRDALDAGLVDTLGTLEDAIAIAGRAGGLGEGPYRTRILPRPKTFFERLNQELYGQAASIWQSLGRSEVEQELLRQKRMLEQAVGQHGTVQARLPFDIRIH